MAKTIKITFYNPKELWRMFWNWVFWPRRKQCAEKLMFYTDKYAQATFLTRWYWKRKMEKFIKGIDVLKEL